MVDWVYPTEDDHEVSIIDHRSHGGGFLIVCSCEWDDEASVPAEAINIAMDHVLEHDAAIENDVWD